MDFYSHTDHIFHSCNHNNFALLLRVCCCCAPITFYHTSNSKTKIAQFVLCAYFRSRLRIKTLSLRLLLSICIYFFLCALKHRRRLFLSQKIERKWQSDLCVIYRQMHVEWKICEYANESSRGKKLHKEALLDS